MGFKYLIRIEKLGRVAYVIEIDTNDPELFKKQKVSSITNLFFPLPTQNLLSFISIILEDPSQFQPKSDLPILLNFLEHFLY